MSKLLIIEVFRLQKLMGKSLIVEQFVAIVDDVLKVIVKIIIYLVIGIYVFLKIFIYKKRLVFMEILNVIVSI